MNGITHRGIMQEVAQRIFPKNPEIVADLVQFSTAPDNLTDILIGPTRTSLRVGAFGATFNSLTHFVIPTGFTKMRGYCMGRDGSLPKIARPKWIMRVYTFAWDDVLRTDRRSTHPVQTLLNMKRRGVKITTDPFHCTFPTGAIMASWVEKNCDPKKWQRSAACVAHYACDACIQHHVQGVLLNGHQQYEARIGQNFLRYGPELIEKKWDEIERLAARLPASSRRIVEMQAETTGAFRSRPTSVWAIKYGAAATLRVLQVFRQRYFEK